MSVRLRVAGGQVQTDWMQVDFIAQRDGRRVAHARVQGGDFRPPVELGTEILIDIEDRAPEEAPISHARPAEQPAASSGDAKDRQILALRAQLARLDSHT